MKTGVGHMFLLAVTSAIMPNCGADPSGPVAEVQRQLLVATGLGTSAVPPEEEIFGNVYRQGMLVATNEGYRIRLTPLGSGACIYRMADAPGICRSTQTQDVKNLDTRNYQWGWFNSIDVDPNATNPCNRDLAGDKNEKHGGSGLEAHCVTLGSYRVELVTPSGGVLHSRDVDHLPAKRIVPLENTRTVELYSGESVSDTTAADTYVHFELQSSVQGSATFAVDNPFTEGVFAPGDTSIVEDTPLRFALNNPSTSGWNPNPNPPGRLLYRVQFNVLDSQLLTKLANPDFFIRSIVFLEPSVIQSRADIFSPSSGSQPAASYFKTIVVNDRIPIPWFHAPHFCVLPDTSVPAGHPLRFLWCDIPVPSGNYQHKWDPGDGSGWTSWMPAGIDYYHTYATPGTYAAKHRVREVGTSTTYTENVQILVEAGEQSCPTIHHVNVAISNGLINLGESSNLQAIPKDVNNNSLGTMGCTISWSSTSQVSVSQDSEYPHLAIATGFSAGTATVTATIDGISGTGQIVVSTPPAGDNAQPYGTGNSFPPTMYQGQFYAVSVYMENTGGTTWSAPNYTLQHISGTGFEPLIVQLTQSVAPGVNYPFSFNLYNDAIYNQGYDVRYQMHRSGNGIFGQASGRWIDVLDPSGCTKNCDPTALPNPIGQFVPGGASAGDMSSPSGVASGPVDDVVQSLVIEDYPLYFHDDDGTQIAYIRYFGALGASWSVDVTFRLSFDPGTIQIGQVKKAIALSGYELEILNVNAHQLIVRLNRRSDSDALPSERMMFLSIPLIAVPGRAAPSTLPSVELTVQR